MANIPYPHDNPEAWDVFKLGKHIFPGIVQDVQAPNVDSYQIIQKRAFNKARVRYKGKEPRKISVQILISTEEEFNKLQEIKKQLPIVNPSIKTINSYVVTHPRLKTEGIKKVWVRGYDESYPDAEFGFDIYLELLEDLDATRFIIDDVNVDKPNQESKNKGKKAGANSANATTNRDPATGVVGVLS